jgi:hypothetical protein
MIFTPEETQLLEGGKIKVVNHRKIFVEEVFVNG